MVRVNILRVKEDAIYVNAETINLNQVCSKQAEWMCPVTYDPVNLLFDMCSKEFYSKIYRCRYIE